MKAIIVFFAFILLMSSLVAQMQIELNGSNGLDNRIELNWQLQNYGEIIFQDNFDTYSNADLQFGDWILMDLDNAATIEFIDQNYHFPHPNEAFAWTITNWENANVSSFSLPNSVSAIANLNGVPNNDWLISPEIYLSEQDFSDAKLSFWVNPVGLGLSVEPEHIKVLVSTGGTEPSNFIEIGDFWLYDKDVWKNITLNLASYLGQNIRVAINYCSIGNVCVSIDDFTVFGYPDLISGFKVYRTETSQQNYQLLNETSNLSYIDFDVVPSRTYYYVVSAILNENQESDYSNEVSCFANGMVINEFPYSENFDNVTPPNLPQGFSVQNCNNDDKTWETHNGGANSSPNCMKYTYSSENAADDWFFTPPIQVLPSMDYVLTFAYRGNIPAFTEKLEVKLGQYASYQAMSEQIFSDEQINFNEYSQIEINIPHPNYQKFVLGWHVYSDADQAALYVDDITIDAVLSFDNDIISNENIMLSNYPNPFNPSTTIYYDIKNNFSDAILKIYNLRGELIKKVILDSRNNKYLWNGTDMKGKNVASGIYIYQLQSKNKVLKNKKMILLK